ncbi:MAG: hypothetical protein R2776_01495 [Flavobacteriaceae bacterium]|nr:hypothetical protein [Flavobacteriaceae bacterium]
MKIFRFTLIIIAFLLVIYNATKLNFENLFEGESQVAVIGILAAACVILLMVILNISHKIKEKRKV